MAKIVATPCPKGINMPCTHLQSGRDITDDLPADVIGECVTEAVSNAWKNGFDPVAPEFVVLVKFS